MYLSRLFNFVDRYYIITKRKALVMVYAIHKFRHYTLNNRFTFFVDHMALVYLINKPKISNRLATWLLLFLEYDFKIVYEPSRSHLMEMHLVDYPTTLNLLEYLIKHVMLTYLLYNPSGYKVYMNTY